MPVMEEAVATGRKNDVQVVRRAAIIDAARAVFFESGFGGASMNAIAARIGGSKTTLWAYFPSKDALFEAVVDDLVDRYGSRIEAVDLDIGDVASTLRRFGLAVLIAVTSPDIMSLLRLVVSEAERFPELGKLYFRRGPGRAEDRLASFFAEADRAKLLAIGEPERAAEYFLALCQASAPQRLLLGRETQVEDQRLQEEVDAAVETFCRAFDRAE